MLLRIPACAEKVTPLWDVVEIPRGQFYPIQFPSTPGGEEESLDVGATKAVPPDSASAAQSLDVGATKTVPRDSASAAREAQKLAAAQKAAEVSSRLRAGAREFSLAGAGAGAGAGPGARVPGAGEWCVQSQVKSNPPKMQKHCYHLISIIAQCKDWCQHTISNADADTRHL